MAFLWNVLDRNTRFLLASKLYDNRSMEGAELAFKDAINSSHESLPETVFTDSLASYNDGLAFAFKGKKMPTPIKNAGITKPHATNNRIERLNGTLRERIKVQRGWKSFKSQLSEGQRFQYNFVKPHIALDGQTPA